MIGIGFSVDKWGAPDLTLDRNGDLLRATGVDAIAGHIRQRIMTFEGEWFIDNTVGVPWLTDILGKRFDITLAESLIKTSILDTPGVSSINRFSVRFDRVTRRLSGYNIEVKTESGEVVRI